MRLSASATTRTFLVLISVLSCARAAAPRPISSPPRRVSSRRRDDDPTVGQSTATSSSSQDFTMQVNPPSFTVSAVGDGSSGVITLTGTGGFAGTVKLSCEVSPEVINPASCFVFGDQANVDSSSSPSMVMLFVDAISPSCMDIYDGASPRNPGGDSRLFTQAETGIVMLALLTCFTGLGSARRRARIACVAMICTVALLMTGCGGSNDSGFQCSTGVPNSGTPAGMYVITVTATSGSISHSTTIPLTVTSPF